MKKHIVIIIGPSGGGKTTLGDCLKDIGWVEFVSHTTRKPRKNEVDGISYYFVSHEDFKTTKKIEKGAEYPKGSGEFYALSEHEVKNKVDTNDCYCVLDIEGALNLKSLYPDAKIIFVFNEIEVLKQRMIDRGDSLEKIEKRIQNISESKELENIKYADLIIKNDNLEASKKLLLDYLKK